METVTLDRALEQLGALDPATLTDAELHGTVISLQRAAARLAAVSARFVAQWDARKVWADDGSKSPGARLARMAGLRKASGDAIVARARKLATMPATAAAFATGELSVDHVDLLARANQPWRNAHFADFESTLVGFCATMRYHHAYKAVEYWIQRADAAAGEERSARIRDGRSLSVGATLDGVVNLRGTLDPVAGATFIEEVNRLERLMRGRDNTDGITRTATQRRADALEEMAIRSRTAPANGVRPRPRITVLVGHDSFADVCELAAGTVVAPGQIVPHLGDADIERIVFDGPSRVIDVSHKRCFTGALRRAIEVRDRHCQHPSGCDVPAAECDVDHIVAHPHGATDQDNGRLLCPTHNRHPHLRDPIRPPPPDQQRPPPAASGGSADARPGEQRPPPDAA